MPENYAFDMIRMTPRQDKPRTSGITYARDMNLGLAELEGYLENSGDFVDVLKLPGFYPRLQRKEVLQRKIAMCTEAGVEVGLGGALLENAVLQGEDVVHRFLDEVKGMGITHVEVARAIAIISVEHMENLVRAVRDHGLAPLVEVGAAYGITPEDEVHVDAQRIISTMRQCLEAGAWKVCLESEGITESRHPKDYRWDVVSQVAHQVGLENVIFEADDQDVWGQYLQDYGPETNLFVDLKRVLKLEGSRRGGWAQPHHVVNRIATFYGK